MSGFVGPIVRVDTAKGHYYKDANGLRVPGVTTILSNGLPKPALINWAAKATAEYAVDNWAVLSELSPSKRLEKLLKSRYEERDAAAKRGTEVHDIASRVVQGDAVETPDAISGHVESYVQFLDEFQVEPVLVEVVVFSQKYGYCGTLDGIFRFPTLGKTLLCDIKTSRSGIFGDVALQLAGYRYAEVYIDEHGAEQPMLEVDGCAGIHVRADGYSLIPVTADLQQHRDLLYVAQVGRFDKESRDLVGAAVTPPNRLRRRRLEVVEDVEQKEIDSMFKTLT